MSAAVICGVRVAAAHDGAAELVVTLRHDNGGCSDVSLDEHAAAALLSACNATSPAELEGQGWQRVMEALAAGWNRCAPVSRQACDRSTTTSTATQRRDPAPQQG
ncbi:MAG: hypothetical protein ACNA7W_19675 [Pseudomonadales bacterium]